MKSMPALIVGALRAGQICCCVVLSLLFVAVLRADEPLFEKQNWPFQPLTKPALPKLELEFQQLNPIDQYILAKLQKQQLTWSELATKRMWLRRVTNDLTGLLPTTKELTDFLADESDQAYDKVVDRLLASPRYGEHWAKYWLDLVRYAETAGYKVDEHRPEAYRYRDYVVQAFNKDLPYDRFIRQQLAGDELEPHNPEAIIATGYNRLYPFESNTGDFVKARQDVLDDLTEVTGFVFMGLTLGCAKCHDHKFDPIEQEDFYRLQAVFTPLLPRDDVPAAPIELVRQYQAKEQVWKQKTESIQQQMEELVSTVKTDAMKELSESVDPATGKAMLKKASTRTTVEQQLMAFSNRLYSRKMNRLPNYLEGSAKEKYETLKVQLQKYEHLKPAPLPLTMSVTDVSAVAPETHLLEGGNYKRPVGEALEPGVPDFLGEDDLDEHPLKSTTGRRTALANWLTHTDHPLTARVWINRVWQYHFGVGIVPTANDFGVMGESATHPELLDWLASDFVEHGWHLKRIQKLIVLSRTYRQTSLVDPQQSATKLALSADPQNHLLWHFRRQRMSGESIRDVVLQLSGRLNTQMGGPSGKAPLPAELETSRYYWTADADEASYLRRSIYTFTRRNLRLPILGAFDPPDLITSCSKRSCTVTSPQALTLLNGEFTLTEARWWSGKLLQQHSTDLRELILAAYQQAFHRAPSAKEIEQGLQFIEQQSELISQEAHELDPNVLPVYVPEKMSVHQAAAIADYCHALLNASELSFID